MIVYYKKHKEDIIATILDLILYYYKLNVKSIIKIF
jgi:hypothetical protein